MLAALKREQLQWHNRTPIRCWADLLLLLLLLLGMLLLAVGGVRCLLH
jgi:hypothetical protein